MMSRRIAFVAALAGASLAWSQTTRSVWEGIYSKEQAAKGSGLYQQECAGCHGTSLTGGESAPPLMGGEFLSNWTGLSVGDLYERIRTTMPATRPGTLNRETNAAILAYILEVNQYPAGEAALPQQTEIVAGIEIDHG